MDLILNELSLRQLPATAGHAATMLDAWLKQLTLLAQARKVVPAFRALTQFRDMQVAEDGTVFQQWLTQLPTDRKRLVLAFTTKAPFIHYFPEYRFLHSMPAGYQGAECKGLAYAAENNVLAWSMDPYGQWTDARYLLHCTTVDEALDVDEYELEAWHLPATGETAEHQVYYAGALEAEDLRFAQEATSGAVLLKNWEEWFPALILTEIGRQSLEELNTDAARPVAERLLALQRYFASWDRVPANYDKKVSYKTSQESDSRLQQLPALQLRCPDGLTRAMSWHVRYTPQAGRLYFVPEAETGNCYIGYIGHKIV
jgi:hypothetical protein